MPTERYRSLLLGCLSASIVPAVVMVVLLLANLAPDPLMRPEGLGGLVTGTLMVATVALVVGLVLNVLVGFPVLAALTRVNYNRVPVAVVLGAVFGAALGGGGFFGGNAASWALVCGIIGALCGAVASVCSRPNSTPHPDARATAAVDQPPSARAGERGR